jgi:hypothetical protein
MITRQHRAPIDPEIGVVDAAPAEAARRPLSRHLTGRAEKSQSPLVLPIVDEREVHAAVRLCRLQSRYADVADVVPAHQRHGVAGQNPRAVKAAAVQDHPLETDVVARRRRQPTAAVEGRGRTLWLIRLIDERRAGAAIRTPMNRHEPRLFGIRNVVEGVGHLQRREDALAEVLLEVLSRELLDQPPEPIDAGSVDPLRPWLEEQRARWIGFALARLEIANNRTGESVSKT